MCLLRFVVVTNFYHSGSVLMAFQTWVVLIIFDMVDLEIILGMTWLTPYQDFFNCNTKAVTLVMHGMDKIEWEGVFKAKSVKIMPFI